jgi:hypothetical protein
MTKRKTVPAMRRESANVYANELVERDQKRVQLAIEYLAALPKAERDKAWETFLKSTGEARPFFESSTGGWEAWPLHVLGMIDPDFFDHYPVDPDAPQVGQPQTWRVAV